MNNLPIYRAEKIDSDEYVEGYYASAYDIHHYIIDHLGVDTKTNTVYSMSTDLYKIDPTTLAIHFPDTNIKDLFFGVDSKKGASIIEALFIEDNTPFKGVAMHTHYGYVFYDKNDDWVHISKLWNIKVIGIQQ